MTHVFRGERYRAQLKVWDWTGDHAKYAAPDKAGKIIFTVSILPAKAPLFSAYRGGCVYYGEHLTEALNEVSPYTKISVLDAYHRLTALKSFRRFEGAHK